LDAPTSREPDALLSGGSAGASYAQERRRRGVDALRAQKQLPNIAGRVKAVVPCARSVFPGPFFVLKQPGDGSCFFASLANGIMGEKYNAVGSLRKMNSVAHEYRREFCRGISEQTYESLRRRIARQAAAHHRSGKAPPPPDMPTYPEFQRKCLSHSTWADLPVIAAIALKYHVNLYFWDEKGCKFYYGTDRNTASRQSPTMRTVIINWTGNHSHFELIVKEDPSTGRIRHHFTRATDGPFLRRLEQHYERGAAVTKREVAARD
jgi:hypothetical protein